MNEIVDMINQYGVPVVVAVGMAYFIFYIWKFVTSNILPSGENAHCTVEPIGFWETMIEKYAPKRVYTHLKTYGNCNNYSILNEDLYLECYLEQI